MSDRKAAEQALREALARMRALCAGATARQWAFRPSAAAWSMSHVVEHVAISTDGIARMLSKRLADSPLAGRATDVADFEIPYLFYRGDEPPDVARPSGSWSDPAAAAARLDASGRSLLDAAGGIAPDLRAFALPHPVFGLLDGIQWLLFAAAHLERHRAQVIGLAGHPEFPR